LKFRFGSVAMFKLPHDATTLRPAFGGTQADPRLPDAAGLTPVIGVSTDADIPMPADAWRP
jgi:hypothetical protein